MPEWISVKDRLPEERQFVLLCPKYEGIVALGYRHRICGIDFWECLKPTLVEYEVPWVGAGIVEFWMPLPEPPEEGGGCKFEQDEICVNADCPMCADFCPVRDTPGVCRFEERWRKQNESTG